MSDTNKTPSVVLAVDTSSDMLCCAVGRMNADGSAALLASRDQLCRRHARTWTPCWWGEDRGRLPGCALA